MTVLVRANDTGCAVFSSPLLFSRWVVQLCFAIGTTPSLPAPCTQGVKELPECSCSPRGFGHTSLSVAMPWQQSPLAHRRSSRGSPAVACHRRNCRDTILRAPHRRHRMCAKLSPLNLGALLNRDLVLPTCHSPSHFSSFSFLFRGL